MEDKSRALRRELDELPAQITALEADVEEKPERSRPGSSGGHAVGA